jgi:hypothetical protein
MYPEYIFIDSGERENPYGFSLGMKASLPPPPLKVLQLLNNSTARIKRHLLNYKFRLYPTKEQESALEQTLDGCRWVYNYFLSIS